MKGRREYSRNEQGNIQERNEGIFKKGTQGNIQERNNKRIFKMTIYTFKLLFQIQLAIT